MSREILSTWTNPAYPKQKMRIVRDAKLGLGVDDGGGMLNLSPETFIGYENLLWANGWRKQHAL